MPIPLAVNLRATRSGPSGAIIASQRRNSRRHRAVTLRNAILQLVEPRVQAAVSQQLVVIALFPDLAVVDDENAIGVLDRRQPVGDDQRSAIFQELVERLLNQRFGLGIHRARRFIENEYLRIESQGPGERQELALALGYGRAALLDFFLETMRQLVDKRHNLRPRRRLGHALLG